MWLLMLGMVIAIIFSLEGIFMTRKLTRVKILLEITNGIALDSIPKDST